MHPDYGDNRDQVDADQRHAFVRVDDQALVEDESRGWDEGVLEDLKRQRDSLVSVRELFDRRDRLDKDNIPYLERRIQSNETKLANLRSKPEGMVKASDIEKVAEAIIKVRNPLRHSKTVVNDS
jgi:sorting nexin-8